VRRAFGPVIAERRLVSRKDEALRVRVSLGRPRPGQSEGEWECPFRIQGPGASVVEFGYGVDSMQALTTALEGIRAIIDEKFTSLAWDGLLDDTGFQRFIPITFGRAFSRRLERLVDRECALYVRQLKRRRLARRAGGTRSRVKGARKQR
jgi:hypothetical protein